MDKKEFKEVVETYLTSSFLDAETTVISGSAVEGDRSVEAAEKTLFVLNKEDVEIVHLAEISIERGHESYVAGGVADFEVLEKLGEGGVGVVEAAFQRSLERTIALKTSKESEKMDLAEESILHEGKIMGRVEHPNIIPVYQLGYTRAGSPVMVMKKVTGWNLKELLKNKKHLAWTQLISSQDSREEAILEFCLEVLVQICRALEYAHSVGVLHRDIKPENIMIGAFGEVYLLDWGIAIDTSKLGSNGGGSKGILGTPSFMAPEMAMGNIESHDERTDVYLLGGTLHFILTGFPPHLGQSLLEVMYSAALSEPFHYKSDVPGMLADLCHRSMRASQDERLQSVTEFRLLLKDFLKNKQAIRLGNEAQEKLCEITLLMEEKLSDEAVQSLYQKLTECRFGFFLSLREYPGNQQSVSGLEACLELQMRLELENRHLQRAKSLLDDMSPKARERWSDKVSLLEDSLKQEQGYGLELQERKRNEDLFLHWRFLCTTFFCFAVFSVFRTLFFEKKLEDGAWLKPTIFSTIQIQTIVMPILVSVFVAILWRLRQPNKRSKQALLYLLFFYYAMALILLTCYFLGIQQLHTSLFFAMSMAIFLGVGAIFFSRFFFVLSGIYLATFAGIWTFPEHTNMIFRSFVTCSWLSCCVYFFFEGRRREKSKQQEESFLVQ